MLDATICFLIKESPSKQILLGMKKRGFGEGRFNGFGGKNKADESIVETAVRELREESGIDVLAKDLEFAGELSFVFPAKPEWNQNVTVFFVHSWKGAPAETEEMKPEWFDIDKIPFDRMWDSDKHWLPLLLQGKKIKADLIWKGDNKTLKDFNWKEV